MTILILLLLLLLPCVFLAAGWYMRHGACGKRLSSEIPDPMAAAAACFFCIHLLAGWHWRHGACGDGVEGCWLLPVSLPQLGGEFIFKIYASHVGHGDKLKTFFWTCLFKMYMHLIAFLWYSTTACCMIALAVVMLLLGICTCLQAAKLRASCA